MVKCSLWVLQLLLAYCALWSVAVAGQQSYPVDVQTRVGVPMRDGVRLSTNVFLPKGEGKWPVILMRSPYGKGDEKQGDGLWVTSNVFLKGHRIRVEISSSNFPRFDRNLNTGEPCSTGTTWTQATQTVYHDRDHPSCIVLPAVPALASTNGMN